MAKWADYGISAVRFNREHTHIDQVRVLKDSGDSLTAPETETRGWVVAALRAGTTFVTLLAANGNWNRGQVVHRITIHGVDYIRSDSDSTAKDNLDNLPEF